MCSDFLPGTSVCVCEPQAVAYEFTSSGLAGFVTSN